MKNETTQTGNTKEQTMRTETQIIADIQALADKGRALNKLHNEGCDGYDHTDQAGLDRLWAELKTARGTV